jgi:hypothetical protein
VPPHNKGPKAGQELRLRARPVVLGRCAQDTCIPGRLPWGSVVVTQRSQGPVMLRRTASPIARICPIQAFAVSTTIFGRNRRTSKAPRWIQLA